MKMPESVKVLLPEVELPEGAIGVEFRCAEAGEWFYSDSTKWAKTDLGINRPRLVAIFSKKVKAEMDLTEEEAQLLYDLVNTSLTQQEFLRKQNGCRNRTVSEKVQEGLYEAVAAAVGPECALTNCKR